ncbi:unnamed protein product [Brassicogethes aeneus]|uniref:Uncharacterized protein n=1 Tax=Brassicogethes aeneus TaxID=1431903 RepID=A0A9P0B931_BRAAE|nr:unnamed protein product [Brassicogethes aeneus]
MGLTFPMDYTGITCLEDHNLTVEVFPTNLLNRVSVEMCDKTIFTCDITNLKFNIDADDDAVCRRAVEAVLEAKTASEENRNLERAKSKIGLFWKSHEKKKILAVEEKESPEDEILALEEQEVPGDDEESENDDMVDIIEAFQSQEYQYDENLFPVLNISSDSTIVGRM